MRVLVVGGRGHYGSRVVEALRQLDDAVVTVSSRATGGLDLCDPSSFGALVAHDVVVTASDAVGAPVDDLARHVLREGGILVDMGADTIGVERVLRLDTEGARGSVVLGAGVFPGLSTALALEVAARGTGPLQTGVRITPFSGAGPGNVTLMVHTLEAPSVYWEGGARREGPAVGPAAPLPFVEDAPPARGPRVGLPDAPLLAHALPGRDVSCHMALDPEWLRFNLAALAGLAAVPPLRPAVRAAARVSLGLLRGWMLRDVTSPVDMVATCGGAVARARYDDGFVATGCGTAAIVDLCREPPPGVHVAGALLPFDRYDARARSLGA